MTTTRFSVRLVQHTPIIHFQHDQEGATLRATELKPKLDRYLASFISPNKDGKFRYQLRIRPWGEQTQNDKRFGAKSLYFGNMGDGEEKRKEKHAVAYAEGAELGFNTYFNQPLAEAIRKALPRCLALENFGTRQNKGYGCFYIDPGEEGFPGLKTALEESERPVYVLGVPRVSGGNPNPAKRNQPWEDALLAVEALYKAMKSGINETSFKNDRNAYLKSLLWRYVNDHLPPASRITWEKRYLKLLAKGTPPKDGEYLRAVLGVANQFIFKSGKAGMDPEYNDTGDVEFHGTKTFKVSGQRISRFKSPITFKPAGGQVFILLHPDAYEADGESLWGAPFGFSGPPGNATLCAPKSFDLVGFMDFVMNTFRSQDFGAFKNSTTPTAKIIHGLSIARLV